MPNPVEMPRVDFLGGAVGHRFRSGASRGHALVRAVGLKPGCPLAVVDATAGLGRDDPLGGGEIVGHGFGLLQRRAAPARRVMTRARRPVTAISTSAGRANRNLPQ